MKIVIVAHYFYPHVGGIEIVAYNQAKELARRGHEVVVISSKTGEEAEEELIDGFKIKRVKIFNLFEKKWGIPYPVFYPQIFSVVKKEVKDADIVHVHDIFYLSPFIGSFCAGLCKKPLILMQHIKKVNDRRRIVNLAQDLVHITYSKPILRNSKKIITCNKEVMNWVNRNDKTIFLENCVDISLFKPISQKKRLEVRKKYNLPLDKPIVIFVGRLFEKKGFQKLFEARSKDYFILFVGSGLVPEHMKQDKDAKFIDFKPQKELSELYSACDVFCLPSINEGFPLTILEAMACGLPIVTSDNPGYKDYLDEKLVKLISPNPKDIKIAIKEVLGNKKLRDAMANYSRKEVEKRFSWKNNVNQIEDIYKEVIKNETTKK